MAYLNTNNTVRAVQITTGKLLLTYAKDVSSIARPGSGSASPAIHDGRVYLRSTFDQAPALVLNATTGRRLADGPHSQNMLAITGTTIISTQGRWRDNVTTDVRLRRTDTTTRKVHWTQKLPRSSSSPSITSVAAAPLIHAGTVWVLTVAGMNSATKLVAYDLKTGTLRWSTPIRCTASGDTDTYNGWSNLAIANGRIYIPTRCGIFTYRSATP